MAHTKAKSSTKLGRDSESKRLGVKKFGSELVKAGNILIRQRGSKWESGENTAVGADDTIYSKINGYVKFYRKAKTSFTGQKHKKTIISVVPLEK